MKARTVMQSSRPGGTSTSRPPSQVCQPEKFSSRDWKKIISHLLTQNGMPANLQGNLQTGDILSFDFTILDEAGTLRQTDARIKRFSKPAVIVEGKELKVSPPKPQVESRLEDFSKNIINEKMIQDHRVVLSQAQEYAIPDTEVPQLIAEGLLTPKKVPGGAIFSRVYLDEKGSIRKGAIPKNVLEKTSFFRWWLHRAENSSAKSALEACTPELGDAGIRDAAKRVTESSAFAEARDLFGAFLDFHAQSFLEKTARASAGPAATQAPQGKGVPKAQRA